MKGKIVRLPSLRLAGDIYAAVMCPSMLESVTSRNPVSFLENCLKSFVICSVRQYAGEKTFFAEKVIGCQGNDVIEVRFTRHSAFGEPDPLPHLRWLLGVQVAPEYTPRRSWVHLLQRRIDL